MAKQSRGFYTESLADNATVAGTEEVVATLAGVSPSTRDDRIRLIGNVLATGAAGTTTLTARIRRDSLTGAVVGESGAVDITGAISADATIVAEDTSRGEGSFTYVLTVAIAGAAATVNAATLHALVG